MNHLINGIPALLACLLSLGLAGGLNLFAAEATGIRLKPGNSEGLNLVMNPGEIKSFWVKNQDGADGGVLEVNWALTGPGQVGVTPGDSWAEYRAPRTGGNTSFLTATSSLDPSQKVVYEIQVRPNSAPMAPAVVDLLPSLATPPVERRQGACSDCYAWAATAAIELELFRQYGIKDRLSIQYFHSIYRPLSADAPTDPCCANNFSAVLEHYMLHGRMVPWANPNADFKDGASRCGISRPPHEPVGLLPNYKVRRLTSQQIETKLWSNEDIINELKHVLSQGRAVITKVGGHYVDLVGYDATDPDPLNHRWQVLDSATASPRGVYAMPMRPTDYNHMDGPNDYSYQFDYVDCLDLDLQAPALPESAVSPAKAELILGESLRLAASVAGRPPVTYQWEKDGCVLPGATGSVLDLPAVALTDTGRYAVQVTNGTGTLTSAPVPVTVIDNGVRHLKILSGEATLGAGTSRTFRAVVTGVVPTEVMWTVVGEGHLSDPMANPVIYTAPVTPAPSALRAHSVADPTLEAVVPVTVKSMDLNGDGGIDVIDLAYLVQAFRSARGDAHFLDAADLNGDGRVDEDDANAFLEQWDAK